MTDAPTDRWLARRQLAVAVMVLIGAAGLLWAGRIDMARWADVTIWTLGLYMLGETGGAAVATWKRAP